MNMVIGLGTGLCSRSGTVCPGSKPKATCGQPWRDRQRRPAAGGQAGPAPQAQPWPGGGLRPGERVPGCLLSYPLPCLGQLSCDCPQGAGAQWPGVSPAVGLAPPRPGLSCSLSSCCCCVGSRPAVSGSAVSGSRRTPSHTCHQYLSLATRQPSPRTVTAPCTALCHVSASRPHPAAHLPEGAAGDW